MLTGYVVEASVLSTGQASCVPCGWLMAVVAMANAKKTMADSDHS